MTVLMQNKTKTEWTFRGNGGLVAASAITVRGVLSRVMESLDGDDGRVVVPLGQGDPSTFLCFRMARIAEDAVVDAVRSAEFNCYTPTVGLKISIGDIADHLSHDHPHKLSPDDVYLTIGGTQAIEVVVTAVARPGANIFLSRPGYPCYVARAALCGLKVRYFDLLPNEGWEVDLERVEDVADANTIAMVIINLGNLCGIVFNYQHLKEITETARKLGIMVIADEVYNHLAFGDMPFVPMGVFASIAPVLTEGSLSKRWIVLGWRLGWVATIDPNGFLKDAGVVESIVGFLNVSPDPATFVQAAIPRILEKTDEEFFSKVLRTLREAVDICHDKIREVPCLACPKRPEGPMFAMVKLNSSLLEDVEDDLDFSVKLAREESVVVLPGIALGTKSWLRITFADEPSSLEDGHQRMKAFCQRQVKKRHTGSTCSSERGCNL
ncbi:probable aminotransferase TAT2 [Syzygium oleosum]|uniref:probable aminotransferase TAT2 n=1 Tax=Syzygium oleosum TaxID=219896 RepID=UPI0011D1FB8C|nr:probable aminotransferase TAT2 [Syzygium oleosum]